MKTMEKIGINKGNRQYKLQLDEHDYDHLSFQRFFEFYQDIFIQWLPLHSNMSSLLEQPQVLVIISPGPTMLKTKK